MAKEISGYIKLQIMGGQANPAPPVGPALGQRGINIMEFCKAFNDKTKAFAGEQGRNIRPFCVLEKPDRPMNPKTGGDNRAARKTSKGN